MPTYGTTITSDTTAIQGKTWLKKKPKKRGKKKRKMPLKWK